MVKWRIWMMMIQLEICLVPMLPPGWLDRNVDLLTSLWCMSSTTIPLHTASWCVGQGDRTR